MPDIMDFMLKEIAEIKPLSRYGLATGPIQLTAYIKAANRLNVPGAVYKPWTPSGWPVGVRLVTVPEYPDYLVFTIGNAYGLIFYKAFRMPKTECQLALITLSVAFLAKQLENVIQSLKIAARQGQEALVGVVAYLDQVSDVALRIAMSNYMARTAISAITAIVISQVAIRVNLCLATRGIY